MNNVTLIKFSAPWCSPCKVMESVVTEVLNGFDLEVININIDRDAESCKKYEVRSIPTLILLKEGQVLDRLVGNVSKERVKEFLSNR